MTKKNIEIKCLPNHDVFVIRILVIRYCFVFRYSLFVFCYSNKLPVLINYFAQKHKIHN